ncbi:MAG: DUF882 domain-containing protein [Xanthobacteraceae bacterium]
MSKAVNAGYCGGIAAIVVFFGANTLQNAVANGDTRTISFHHIHLKEDTTITYKVNGRYDAEALKKINWALRDWRTNAPTQMDPHLIDALWEVYREVGATEPIHVIGGYRSPATNAMLRRRSSGVAKYSQHMRGKAIDFFIPGVSLESVREAGLRVRRGGVGYYPSSGAPFVHMDTGNVRHWPRMPEAQLARVMAKGPLTQVASNSKARSRINPFASLFSGGRDEDKGETTTAATAPSRVAAATPTESVRRAAVVEFVPIPPVKPAIRPPAAQPSGFQLASASSQPVAQPGGMQLASASSKPVPARPVRRTATVSPTGGAVSANAIVNERGYWKGLVEPAEIAHLSAPSRNSAPARQVASADAEPKVTGSVASASLSPWPMPSRSSSGTALAYAPPAAPTASRTAAPMGSGASRTAPRDTTVAVKGKNNRPAILSPPPTASGRMSDRLNDPWMRAMIVSPNAQSFMKTSLLGASDYRYLAPHLHKPATSVMMTFSDDPYLGMSTDRFRGHAVVFVATVTFNRQHASLN